MSLSKSPTLTPARFVSHRRNAQKSTGPRTARGKAWLRLNRLRNGWRSREFLISLKALLDAPPGQVELTAQALLSSKQVLHPLFMEAVEMRVQTDLAMCKESPWSRTQRK